MTLSIRILTNRQVLVVLMIPLLMGNNIVTAQRGGRIGRRGWYTLLVRAIQERNRRGSVLATLAAFVAVLKVETEVLEALEID